MEAELRTLILPVLPRCFMGRAPQESTPERPYARMTRVAGDHDYHNRGASGYVVSRVQLDVFGDDYVSTHGATKAVVAAVSGYTGGAIQAIFVDSELDLTGIEGVAGIVDPSELYRRTIILSVHHAE